MAETARMAVFHGAGKLFEVREYPVPDPEPATFFGNRRILGLSHYEAEHLRAPARAIRGVGGVSHKFPLEAINEAFGQ